MKLLKIINLKKKLNLSILPALVIPLLISGPFLPDLIVSLSSFIFLIYVFRRNLIHFFNRKPLIIFFIFSLYCFFVSIFMAKDLWMSLESSLFYFRIGVFACLIWYLIEMDLKVLNYVYKALIFCFSVLVIDGYVQFFVGYNIFGLPASGARISSFFGDELIMGSYLSRLFPLLFALFVIKKKNKNELYYIGSLFVLIYILIFMSGERAAFFYFNFSTLFIILLIKNYKRFRLITLMLSSIIILILTLTNPDMKNRIFDDPLKTMGLLKNSEKQYIFTPAHDNLIRVALNMFKDKPIFGHGPKMFRVVCKDEKYVTDFSCLTHPHNFYVQLLAETGIIGFMFLLGVLIYVIYSSIRQVKTILFRKKSFLTDYQVCLLACILITVWPFVPNGNFFNNWLAICYSFPAGFYLHSIYGKNNNKLEKCF